MVQVFLYVLGAKIHSDTKLFIGWFSPLGLASIVFVVMVKQANIPGTETLIQEVTWTVLLSIIAHRITCRGG